MLGSKDVQKPGFCCLLRAVSHPRTLDSLNPFSQINWEKNPIFVNHEITPHHSGSVLTGIFVGLHRWLLLLRLIEWPAESRVEMQSFYPQSCQEHFGWKMRP